MRKVKEMEINGGKEILLILMFRGQYLQDNIGHEIINMFKADDGKNYIYVNPHGTFHKSHAGKIEDVLLGRYAGDNCIEIIAKAEMEKEIVDVTKSDEVIRNDQIKDCAAISYGGKNIIQIFDENDSQIQRAWASLLVKNYRRTKKDKKLFITDDPSNHALDQNIFFIGNNDSNALKIRFPKQSLKAYYTQGTETDAAYNKLKEIIGNTALWEDHNKTKKIKKKDAEDKYGNFLKLIHKENDELSFSNLLAHYLSPRFGLMQDFTKEILGIENFGNTYTIEREWENIDLLIEDERQIIVIENKIKSKINGIRHDIESSTVQSQLKKYIDEANERAQRKTEKEGENKPPKLTKFYIFTPNYNHIDVKKYLGGEQYKTINYSEIHKFFDGRKPLKADRFYDDFVRALYKHTLDYPDDLYGDMLQKFAESIFI